DGDPLTASSASAPAHGAVSLNANGSFTYTPSDAGYNGPDSFTYTASDGRGGTATGNVSITITPATGPTTLAVSDVTVAEGDSGTTAFNFTITRSGANAAT